MTSFVMASISVFGGWFTLQPTSLSVVWVDGTSVFFIVFQLCSFLGLPSRTIPYNTVNY